MRGVLRLKAKRPRIQYKITLNAHYRHWYMLIVWRSFQRRAQSLATALDLKLIYYHYKWEECGKILKAVSYFCKFIATLKDLFQHRPELIIVQLPPTPLLYAVALYCVVTRNRYISDCNNAMIYGASWVKWPLALVLLRRSHTVLVHDSYVRDLATGLGLNVFVLQDLVPVMSVSQRDKIAAQNEFRNHPYVIVPWSMAADEPIFELFSAAQRLPNILFVVTWYYERLPRRTRLQVPDNIHFSGYIPEPQFNALFSQASAALVCTTREGTQLSGASEAISLGVPLVVSDLISTRRLYSHGAIFVDNNCFAIANGVTKALTSHDELAKRMSGLRRTLSKDVAEQFEVFKRSLPS